MGRGRAKAKQTKVARDLKYSSPATNFSALEKELHGSSGLPGTRLSQRDSDNEPAVDDEELDDYGRWAAGQR